MRSKYWDSVIPIILNPESQHGCREFEEPERKGLPSGGDHADLKIMPTPPPKMILNCESRASSGVRFTS